MRSPLIFYFPYRGTGGVPVLFLRLAQLLRGEYDVYLVDHRDGAMGARVPLGVTLLDIDARTPFPDGGVLVVQSLLPWNLAAADRLGPRTRVLLWNLHPYNLYPYLFSDYGASVAKRAVARLVNPLSALRVRKMRHVVSYLTRHHALVFMDEENRTRTQAFFPGLPIEGRYLPVLSDAPAERHLRPAGGPLRCGWIGRLVDFKAHILSHLMARLDAAVTAVGPITLTVIGDGAHRERLQQEAAALTRLSVTFVPPVPVEQLGRLVDAEIDVLFAMGTSALDGASRGIPTFLVDYSFRPIEGLYRFRLIQESRGFSLGNLVTETSFEATSSLEESLRAVRRDYAALASAGVEYWRAHHSPDAVAGRFRECVAGTSATVGEMRAAGFLSPDPISRAVLRPARRLAGLSASAGFDNV